MCVHVIMVFWILMVVQVTRFRSAVARARWCGCVVAMGVPVPVLFLPTVEGLTFGGSNGGEQRVERPRQGIPASCRLDEQPCVAQLAARAAAQEPPHLRFGLPAAPGGLALQRAERAEVALRVEEPVSSATWSLMPSTSTTATALSIFARARAVARVEASGPLT